MFEGILGQYLSGNKAQETVNNGVNALSGIEANHIIIAIITTLKVALPQYDSLIETVGNVLLKSSDLQVGSVRAIATLLQHVDAKEAVTLIAGVASKAFPSWGTNINNVLPTIINNEAILKLLVSNVIKILNNSANVTAAKPVTDGGGN